MCDRFCIGQNGVKTVQNRGEEDTACRLIEVRERNSQSNMRKFKRKGEEHDLVALREGTRKCSLHLPRDLYRSLLQCSVCIYIQ
jgi:hypothetical protein